MENSYNDTHTLRGIRQHTFVFKPQDMERQGNIILENFCEQHTVLSILFSECADRLVYVCLYKY